MLKLTSPIWFDGQAGCVGHVRVRVRQRAVRLRDADAAGVLVALVDGDHEERVALVDAVGLQPVEERCEGVVIGLQLRLVVRLARARARGEAQRVWLSWASEM